ncbi:hypothetical protein KSP39_PZI017144 [Platanthera zijinensis]|uniref:Alpha-galactosidase n=1 Tax=Platanthera zijinensis TaxID=2320716 RepID=A0AAP0B5R5_9ASPA
MRLRSSLTEDGVEIWRAKYGLPADLEVRIPRPEEWVQNPPRGWLTICEVSLRSGFRFPPCDEVIEILKFCMVPVSQFAPTGVARIMGLVAFFCEHVAVGGRWWLLEVHGEWWPTRWMKQESSHLKKKRKKRRREKAFLDNARVVSSKLLPFGYEYVVIDYLWYRKNVEEASSDPYGYDNLDEWGRLVPDPDRWPSSRYGKGFKEVARKVHDMGLKFGIHLMGGISLEAVNTKRIILDAKGLPYEEDGRTWHAGEIGQRDRPCKWMKNGFLSVNTDLGAGRAFLRSLYQQYADWDVDFDFAAAKKIGANGLHGYSWPDLDMLPFGWLTDPVGGKHLKSPAPLGDPYQQHLLLPLPQLSSDFPDSLLVPHLYDLHDRAHDFQTFPVHLNPPPLVA